MWSISKMTLPFIKEQTIQQGKFSGTDGLQILV